MSRVIPRCLPCITGRMVVSFSDTENTGRETNLSAGKKIMNLGYFETPPLGNVKIIVVFVDLELR